MEKKNLYDREICPPLEDPKTRCEECKFWEERTKKIDFVLASKLPFSIKDLGLSIKELEEGENKLYAIKHIGCSVLIEICPECIVVVPEQRLYGVDKNNNVETTIKYATLLPAPNNSLYCQNCGKTFEHKDVKHAVYSERLLEELLGQRIEE